MTLTKTYFESMVEMLSECGCWIWLSSCNRYGYGRIRCEHKEQQAHRIAWKLYHGGIPEGMFVLHRCDTPSCANPHHLFLGTHADNMQDMANKKRYGGAAMPGRENKHAKLTNRDVMSIRNDNRSTRKIAKDYGVHFTTIIYIKNKRTWAHI